MSRRRATRSLANPGTYALVFECAEGRHISVGAMGEIRLARGFLVYVGSAFGAGGLKGRLRHHLRPLDRPHWHVDYLRPFTSLIGAWCANGPRSLEHGWATSLSGFHGLTAPKAGFGSSDCQCATHLLHAGWSPTGPRTRERLSDFEAGLVADYYGREELLRAVDLPPEC